MCMFFYSYLLNWYLHQYCVNTRSYMMKQCLIVGYINNKEKCHNNRYP